jgi:hypothetical protein
MHLRGKCRGSCLDEDVEQVLDKLEYAIVYDGKECDCELCKEYYRWFDSDEGGEPPPTCSKNAIAFIDFREDDDDQT